MRIAYVITRADAVGGATIHVMEMARAMRERGHTVAIFTGGSGEAADKLAESGAPVLALKHMRRAVVPVRDVRALFELTAAIREFGPDLVSTHTAKAGWLGRAACSRLGLPAIYTPHGLPLRGRMPGARSAVFALAERVAGSWASLVVCVSNAERKLALEQKLAPAARLTVIRNGVRDVPENLRANPGASPPLLVSVARFEAPKDHATLLEALARLRELPWRAALIGSGPLEQESRALAGRLGIADRVVFLGYRTGVAETLAEAQVFALATRSEALPRSILEAMRAGLAVLASNVGGVPEIVEHGRNGLLVAPGDAGAMASALREVMEYGGLRSQLGLEARWTYEARFRLEEMIARTMAAYDEVLTRAGRKSPV